MSGNRVVTQTGAGGPQNAGPRQGLALDSLELGDQRPITQGRGHWPVRVFLPPVLDQPLGRFPQEAQFRKVIFLLQLKDCCSLKGRSR